MTAEMEAENTEVAILGRVLETQNGDLAPVVAESWLKLHFADADERQLRQLSAKAKQGGLVPEEQSLLEAYLHVGRIVDLMKSKARLSLKASR